MTGIVASIVLLVVLEGVMVAVTPFIMPPTECFTVTVPPSAKQDPRVKALLHAYVIIMAAVTAAGAVLTAVLLPNADERASALVMTLIVLAPIIASFAFMLYARRRIKAIKVTESWTSAGSHAAAVISDASVPQPLPLAWELIHVIVVIGLAAFALLAYDRLPDQIPLHAGFDGTVDSYAEKSLGVVMYPVVISAFIGLVFAFAHWGIVRAKRPVDPAAPVSSALAYGQFARIQSIVMLIGGATVNICTGVMFFLSATGALSLGSAGAIVTIAAVVFVVAEIVVALRLGQAGGRVAAELRTSDEVARDDDRFWKLGSFYVNRDDPSIFVPKRFGVGWTVNLGRGAGWALLIGIILLAVGITVASFLLAGQSATS